MNFLKEATATTVLAGPFVDDTDGKTAETALSLTQSLCLLWKEGGTSQSAKNESSSATHRSNGHYTVPLDETDTNTKGQLTLTILGTGALPVRHDFMVVPANVYDSLFSTDKLQVDAVELNSVAASAAKLEKSASAIVTGTVYAGSGGTTSFETESVTEATADHFKGRVVIFTSGALIYQATSITGYALVSGRGQFTIAAVTDNVPDGCAFCIV